MYYVLKTHGEVKNHWGVTSAGVFKTKKEATTFCRNQMKVAEHNIKLVIVKAIAQFKVTEIKFSEQAC